MTIIGRYNSPEEYRDFLSTLPRHAVMHDQDSDLGAPWGQCLHKLIYGDTTNLAQAEKLMQEMRDAQVFTENLPIMQSAVVGCVPNVPALLMGHPKSMFMRQKSEMESISTPLNIYVEVTVSLGLNKNDLVNRGIAALAFALAMSAVRPVEIYAVGTGKPIGGQNTITCVRIETNPIDLARATWMLTSVDYTRRIDFVYGYSQNNIGYRSGINWLWGLHPTSPTYVEKLKKELNCSEYDVLICGGHSTDNLMISNPIAWVKQMIEKHNTRENV